MDVWIRAAREGTPLPAEPVLAEALDVARPAVREHLARLEERGLIHRRRGAQTYVNAAALEIPARFDEQIEQADLIAAMGHLAALEVLDVSLVHLDGTEAEGFGLEEGAPALRSTKRWRADGVAVMVAIDTVPLGVESTALPDELDVTCSVFDLARQIGRGNAEWEIAWPGAVNLDRRESQLLERRQGEAAISLELAGVSRQGAYVYRAAELHVQGAFRYALIRSIRRP